MTKTPKVFDTKTRQHYIYYELGREKRATLKNLTITLPTDVYEQMRIEAAAQGVSMSKYVAEALDEHIGEQALQKRALQSFLSGPKWQLSDSKGKMPTREMMYDRSNIR